MRHQESKRTDYQRISVSTRFYTALEIHSRSNYDCGVDIFSFALVLFELFLPIKDLKTRRMYFDKLKSEKWLPEIFDQNSKMSQVKRVTLTFQSVDEDPIMRLTAKPIRQLFQVQ